MEAKSIPLIGGLEDHELRLRAIEREDAERRVRIEESTRASKADVSRLEKKIDNLTKAIGTGILVFAAAALPLLLQHL